MPVPSTIADLSATAASNSPAGSDAIGTSLDDYLRAIQGIVKAEASAGADIASASSITIPAAGSYFRITGNTAITSIADSWVGRKVIVRFGGAIALTHSSGLIVPGAANITAADGDHAILVNSATGVWRVAEYRRVAYSIDGPATVNGIVKSNGSGVYTAAVAGTDYALPTAASTSAAGLVELATEAEVVTGTSTTLVPSVDAFRKANIVSGTAVATTSGTARDLTDIPSWAKRITVILDGVSTNGSQPLGIQLGDSGGVEASGYSGACATTNNSNGTGVTTSSTYAVIASSVSPSPVHTGVVTFVLISGTTWVWSGVITPSAATNCFYMSGSKTLSGTLDRIRLMNGGSDTFDAGSINIHYE